MIGNTRFWLIRKDATWNDAENFCRENLFGELASANSIGEQKYLFDMLGYQKVSRIKRIHE